MKTSSPNNFRVYQTLPKTVIFRNVFSLGNVQEYYPVIYSDRGFFKESPDRNKETWS